MNDRGCVSPWTSLMVDGFTALGSVAPCPSLPPHQTAEVGQLVRTHGPLHTLLILTINIKAHSPKIIKFFPFIYIFY